MHANIGKQVQVLKKIVPVTFLWVDNTLCR